MKVPMHLSALSHNPKPTLSSPCLEVCNKQSQALRICYFCSSVLLGLINFTLLLIDIIMQPLLMMIKFYFVIIQCTALSGNIHALKYLQSVHAHICCRCGSDRNLKFCMPENM